MPLFVAFDYGEKRIGVAVGDDLTATARPLAMVANTAKPDWENIDRLLAEWKPAACIVGLPLDEQGAEQAITAAARKFAAALAQRCKLPVHLADERYSSRAADEVLRGARASGQIGRRLRKGERDAQAARIILEQWLGSR